MHFPLLSSLIWLPVIGGVITMMVGDDRRANVARWIAAIVAIIGLLLCIPLYANFSIHTSAMQFVEKITWIKAYGVNYSVGVDGISMPMIILTNITTLVVVFASWKTIRTKVAQYMAAFLIMQGMMNGVFAATDALLFYVFWEAMLIPIYLSIGIWGSSNRSYASIKFFMFTFFGSALMLIAILYLRIHTDSFAITSFYKLKMTMAVQIFVFIAFFLAFAVKVPMWPTHTWLPDAHTEAPAGGSVVLAALMLKMGVYGFLRFSLPIVPNACQHLYWFMIVLSLIAIVYIAYIAIAQTDMKRLIAYSSVAHMGFATLGCFMIYLIIQHTGNLKDAYMSLEGGMVQMLSHAFSTGALFVGIGILYDKLHTRMIGDLGGITAKMPVFASLMMLFAMANVGLPGTSGFVGEFMVILSAFQGSFWVAVIAATTVILSACYTLWMFKRVFFGGITNPQIETLTDIGFHDKVALGILAFMVLLIGIYPEVLLRVFHASVGHLLALAHVNKLP